MGVERETVSSRLRAMGTDVHLVLVEAPDGSAMETAMRRLHQLETRWSRFIPDSDVSRLNRAEGRPVAVHADTIELIEKAIAGCRLSRGRFNPLQARRLARLGYDRDFCAVGPGGGGPQAEPAIEPGTVRIDRQAGTVQLPATVGQLGVSCQPVGFDPGGIGKGLAADMLAATCLAAGVAGVMINIGGDIRVAGTPPKGDRWVVTIAEPALHGEAITTVQLISGGIATSTTLRRRWMGPNGERHHLLDPRTGLPTDPTAPVVATAVAGEAWWAEVSATAMLVDRHFHPEACSAIVVEADRSVERRGDFERYESC